MIEKPSDEELVAFLDGELTDEQGSEIQHLLGANDTALGRLAGLAQSTALIRAAFDEVLREPVPERLAAVIRSANTAPAISEAPAEAKILRFKTIAGNAKRTARRHWLAYPVAASILGIVIGGGYAGHKGGNADEKIAQAAAAAATNSWLDNVAGNHKLFVATRGNDFSLADVPADANDGGGVIEKISQRTAQSDVRVPDLKPWGLAFHGARVIVADGEPATELFYTTDDKAIGPLSVVIGNSSRPDTAPTLERRQDVNVMHWRRKGHAYAIVGQADVGYMWGLANDIGWQLDAI